MNDLIIEKLLRF